MSIPTLRKRRMSTSTEKSITETSRIALLNSASKSTPSDDYPIGNYELAFYYLVWIGHSLAAFFVAARAANKTGRWLQHWMEPSDYISGYRMDNSDLEWKLFRNTVTSTIFAFSLHSVMFYFAMRKLSQIHSSIFLATFWIILHFYWTSVRCMVFLSAHITVTTVIVYITRRQIFAWISCVIFVLKANDWAPFSPSPSTYYREFNLYLYTSVQLLNYCIYLSRNPMLRFRLQKVLDYLLYLFYPMYSSTLIVLYDDFHRQLSDVRARIAKNERIVPSAMCIATRAARLLFWFAFLETALHVCRINAFCNSPFTMLTSLHNYELSAIAYVAGQYFHVKYVIIFGIPSLFASIDGMTPPGSPICISRVSKYSQMWRYFDQGLYQFLKNQLYIPLMVGAERNGKWLSSPIIRKLLASSLVFAFVLSWHGAASNYLYWVLLSGLELLIERVGAAIVRSEPWTILQKRMGSTNNTRVTAVAMLFTVIPGIFGVFFFLGKTGVGDHIFSRVLINGAREILTLSSRYANAGFVLTHLLLIGYCFNHVCLHLESKLRPPSKK